MRKKKHHDFVRMKIGNVKIDGTPSAISVQQRVVDAKKAQIVAQSAAQLCEHTGEQTVANLAERRRCWRE